MKIFIDQRQNGQILLVVLLIMIVGLTIGLFLLSRTSTDISLTTKVSDSSRAFNAAEAGIEEAIRSIGVTGATPEPVKITADATYTVGTTALGEGGLYPTELQKPWDLGQAFTVFLVGHDDATGELAETDTTKWYSGYWFYVCFTQNTPPSALPAIGVTIFYRDQTDNQIKSVVAGYDSPPRDPSQRTAGFSLASNNTAGECPPEYDYFALVKMVEDLGLASSPFTHLPLAVRIRPLYAPTSLAVRQYDGNLPKQGNDITSTGNVGEVTRRINVKEPYTIQPPWLDYVLYSTGNTNLSHN